MNRWLAFALVSVAMAGFASAQLPKDPGLMVIRVKLNGTGNSVAAGPGGEIPPMTGVVPPPGGGGGDTRSIIVAVPFKNLYQDVVFTGKAQNMMTNPKVYWLSHDFGKTLLFTDGANVQLTAKRELNTDVIIKAKYAEWGKTQTRSLDALFDLVILSLEYDQVELAITYSKELEKALDGGKVANPPKRVADFVKIYKALAPKFDEVLATPSEADEWQKRLQTKKRDEDRHYTILHYGDESLSQEALQAKMNQLERNLKGFYLWHATIGQKPSFPEKRQLVVICKKATDLQTMKNQFEGSALVSDGFYVSNYNLVVLSPERHDEIGRTFAEMVKTEYGLKGWNRENLLKGVSPKLDPKDNPKQVFDDLFRVSTYALVDRAVEQEANNAVATREGSRQLMVASGMVPQHVLLPRWLDQGLSSFLNKPKNPGVVAGGLGKNVMVIGWAAGYGSPNYLFFREWKGMIERQEITIGKPAALQTDEAMADAAKTLLMNVLNDTYFQSARTGTDPELTAEPQPGGFVAPPMRMGKAERPRNPLILQRPQPPMQPVPPGGQVPPGPGQPMPPGGQPGQPEVETPAALSAKAKIELKAQATAWALVHYLAREKPEGMKKFLGELNKLPRDLRLDKKVALETFARSFSLMTPELTAVDDAALKSFAVAWVKYINAVKPSWVDVPVEAPVIAPPMPMGPVPPGGIVPPMGGPVRPGG